MLFVLKPNLQCAKPLDLTLGGTVDLKKIITAIMNFTGEVITPKAIRYISAVHYMYV